MATTAHSNEEDVIEHFDDDDVLEKKIKELARLIKRSKHLVAFTGAGISTSAGKLIFFFSSARTFCEVSNFPNSKALM